MTHFGDFRTGALFGSLPCTAFSWTSELRAAGTVNVTVPACPEAAGLWSELQDGRALVVVEWAEDFGSRILWASPVVARSLGESSVTVGGSGIFGHLCRVKLVPNVPASQVAKAPGMTFTGDMGTIMRGMVAQVMSRPSFDLPIILEPARSGTRTQTYYGYERATAGQRISELAEHQNGPDFAFLPRFADSSNTSVVWDMVTGTETAPLLNRTAGIPIVVDGTAPGQDTVRTVTWESSAGAMGTTVWAAGGGTEAGSVIRAAVDTSLTNQGWPGMDADSDVSTDSEDGAYVQAVADGALARLRRPLRSVRASVRASFWWGQDARLGDSVRVMFDHPIAGRIDVTSRLLAESGDIASEWVELTLADTLAEEVA